MINTISTYRRFFATLLTCWMGLIVISGIVFMHKEVTSKGEIITHVHPYDFTKKKSKHTHKSDAEIQFLNVLFHGTFTETDFYVFEAPVLQEYTVGTAVRYIEHAYTTEFDHFYLRGPPLLA